MLEIYNADKKSEKLIKKVYKAALKYFSQKDIFEVEIEIVDKDEIQSINKEARGVDAVNMKDDEKAEMREKEEEILKTIGLSR